MKSFTMKALAVAVLGLAGVGSAMAACPTDPFSAWSSDTGGTNNGALLGGTTTGVTPGLNSTSCAMSAMFTTAPGSNGESATVYDQSPQLEQTYRFRFYIDPTAISSSLSSVNTVEVFSAQTTTGHGPNTPASSKLVRFVLLGTSSASTYKLRVLAACTAGDAGVTVAAGYCSSKFQTGTTNTGDITLNAGATRLEGQVTIGATGSGGVVNIWTGANTGTPDRVLNITNTAWGGSDGVKQAVMGLSSSTVGFRNAAVNKAVLFDEFDSRRQTMIGN